MTALLVVLMFVGFFALDLLVRLTGKNMAETRARREREAVLKTSLRLDFTSEAKTLKRVEVTDPRGRILAVDDEPVILDSFRKILVLAGYSVDTVESGPEALGLVQRHDYDLVFTDLKMPGMDGVEVVKAVRHLRPDIDVAVITGYATVESAVETMQYGAADYVQKPFTEDELVAFAKGLSIKRQARLESQRRPTVRIVAPRAAEKAARHEFCVPGGAFVSDSHVWARIEPSGLVRFGVDDFARKALGEIESVEAAVEEGGRIGLGEPLLELKQGDLRARILAPLSGRVVQFHAAVLDQPDLISESPYERGWICLIQPSDLAAELGTLRIGKAVVDWYQEEIARLQELQRASAGDSQRISWKRLEEEFFTLPAHVRA